MTYTIAGTGGRYLAKQPIHEQMLVRGMISDRVETLLILYGELHVVSGMAEGFDELVAQAAYLKDIPYTACIPHSGYGDYYWRRNSVVGRDRYAEFEAWVERAAKVEYVCPTIYVNGVHSNFIRNDRMVELADEFVVFDPRSRGTAHCLTAIKRAKLPYTVLG